MTVVASFKRNFVLCVCLCMCVRARERMPHKQCCPEGKKEPERIERWKVKGSRSYSTTKPRDTHTHAALLTDIHIFQ